MCPSCLEGHRLYCFFDDHRDVPTIELPAVRLEVRPCVVRVS